MEPSAAVAGSRSRGKTLANASWILFLGLVVANSMLRRLSPALADLVVLAGALTALGAGVAALFYARREGRRGIVLPSLIGICLNGLLLLIFVANLMAVRNAAG